MTTQNKIKENHSQEESPGTFGNPGSQEGWKSKPSRSNPALDIKKEIKEMEKLAGKTAVKPRGAGSNPASDIKQKTKAVEKEIEELENKILWIENNEIDEKANHFIDKWCGNYSPHLLDTDENDGQKLRVWIRLRELKATLKTLKSCSEEITRLQEENKLKTCPYVIDLGKEYWGTDCHHIRNCEKEQKAKVEKLKKGLRGFSAPTQYGVGKLIDKIFGEGKE